MLEDAAGSVGPGGGGGTDWALHGAPAFSRGSEGSMQAGYRQDRAMEDSRGPTVEEPGRLWRNCQVFD